MPCWNKGISVNLMMVMFASQRTSLNRFLNMLSIASGVLYGSDKGLEDFEEQLAVTRNVTMVIFVK